eukprot:1424622-Rhodomonas_salina.1
MSRVARIERSSSSLEVAQRKFNRKWGPREGGEGARDKGGATSVPARGRERERERERGSGRWSALGHSESATMKNAPDFG